MNTKEKQRHLHTVDRTPTKGKRPVRRERKLKDSDVIYTPPKPFKRGKFILHLITVAAVVFAIVLMYFSGVTINMISLSGLAVAVGMLVDNSVVVIENIYRLRGRGVSAPRASVQGAKQVAGAIISSSAGKNSLLHRASKSTLGLNSV